MRTIRIVMVTFSTLISCTIDVQIEDRFVDAGIPLQDARDAITDAVESFDAEILTDSFVPTTDSGF